MADKRPRNWLRLSLRTMLLLLTLMCVWLAWRANRAREQAQGRRLFREAGGLAELAWQSEFPQLGKWLGEDFVHEINDVSIPMNADDDWLVHLKSVRTTRSVSLSGQKVTGAGFKHFRQLGNLRSLSLHNLHNLQPEALAHLSRLRKLEYVNVSACPRITDAAAEHLANVENLQSLTLDNCPITDQTLESLRSSRELRVLSLANTKITDAGLAYLAELPRLEELDVRGTAITDEGLRCVAGMTSLKSVIVFETRVTPSTALRLMAESPEVEIEFGSTGAVPPEGNDSTPR